MASVHEHGRSAAQSGEREHTAGDCDDAGDGDPADQPADRRQAGAADHREGAGGHAERGTGRRGRPSAARSVDTSARCDVLGVVVQQRAAELDDGGHAFVGEAIVDCAVLAAGRDEPAPA